MTPLEVNTAARDIYNGVGDSFYSDLQIYNWMMQGSNELAKKAWLIETLSSPSTVAGTQGYAYPTNTIAIKRVTVNGKKLKRITMREDDAVTLSNSTAATQGWPIYYTDFNYTIYLRPIPDAVYTMQVYSYSCSGTITATTTLAIPTLFHMDLVDYVLFRMFSKDKDPKMAEMHLSFWEQHVKDAIAYKNRLKRTDSFATVQSEDTLPVNILGEQ